MITLKSCALLPVRISLASGSNPSVSIIFSLWKYADAQTSHLSIFFFFVSWPELIYHPSLRCPFQPQYSFWGCFHTPSDLGCRYRTGCYMPVLHSSVLYMEIKTPPPRSIPRRRLKLPQHVCPTASFLWTKITGHSLLWFQAQRQDPCSRFSSPRLYLCIFSV